MPAIPENEVRRLVAQAEGATEYAAQGTGRVVNSREVAAAIDHTLLKPEARADDIRRLCDEARQYGFATVCVNPCFAGLAARQLAGSPVRICTVAGFPLGAAASEIKAAEARLALSEGAAEIDMVLNVGALKAGEDEYVVRDIRGVVDACREAGAISKVIIETALLTEEEKVRACRSVQQAGADFVKTSTGFGPGGANARDVALLAVCVAGSAVRVKAAGGVRTLADAVAMMRAGASRLGTSAGVKIMEEARGGTEGAAAAPAGAY